jgi:hypothetical protein
MRYEHGIWRSSILAKAMNEMTLGIVKGHAAASGLHFYSFFYRDEHGHIVTSEDRECDSDSAAMNEGREMLAAGDCPSVDVWLRNMRIGSCKRMH